MTIIRTTLALGAMLGTTAALWAGPTTSATSASAAQAPTVATSHQKPAVPCAVLAVVLHNVLASSTDGPPMECDPE
ncbi:hypothetical protein [Actinomadura kijaniata]|uniref:hypothetical protein n=1 Tax=Actinomadura kijaniata TaxID=46161 RepID=UPI00082C24CF|nr:hypothetical protein [Actinomadura kijaniata]